MGTHSPSLLEKVGYLFYIVDPRKSSFEKHEHVPHYITEAVPLFVALILLEALILKLKKKKNGSIRLNDAIGSITQGMFQELAKVVLRGIDVIAYIYIYNNWRIVALPWDSLWTWFFGFIGVDFAYYWLHRASHEINIFWASHQVHHSSEYYNLSTALRQSLLTNYLSWIFYLPLAFAAPPSVFFVHAQFNLLYQFWIHTELIGNLGVLEYILNTPSHHRVHHGRNRYCIDKNYAGTLIIWDRLFGTFQAEEAKVVYGLTHPINTFQPLFIQFGHLLHVVRTVWKTEGFANKLSVIFKGPGWEPGKPWHGLIEDIPDIHYPQEKYDVKLPFWCNPYIFFHFALVLLIHIEITERHAHFSQAVVLGTVLYTMFSLTVMGSLLDSRTYAPVLELLRCMLFLGVDIYLLPDSRIATLPGETSWALTSFLRVCFLTSAVFWFCYTVRSFSIHFRVKKSLD